MGMDALTGESICPSDIRRSLLNRHHWTYKRWSIDVKDLVLLTLSNHMSIHHPKKSLSSYNSWKTSLW
jgi:hypothetical protein